jgi:hypothetical protein
MSLHNARGEARGNCSMKNNARQSGVEPPHSKKGAELLICSWDFVCKKIQTGPSPLGRWVRQQVGP